MNGTITKRNWEPNSLGRHHNNPTLDGGNLFFTRQEVLDTLYKQEQEFDHPYHPLRFPIFTLHKTNRQGRTEWIKKYPDTLFLLNAIQTLDSGYLIHGRSYDNLHFFQKLDVHGQLIWQKNRTK